jgi:lysophospholipase L1-like esterase
MSPTRAWRPPARAAVSVGGLALTAVLVNEVLRAQARIARKAIGRPLGETVPYADKVYKKKYGAPLDLLVLGDSIAAGLGAERAKYTLGGQLARRVAKRAQRSVRLRTAAQVGAETWMLESQLDALPPGYIADVAVVVVGGNDVTHRVKLSESVRQLAAAVTRLREQGTEVVVGTCPDLGALRPVPQPLRSLAGRASRQLAAAQRDVVTELGGHAVSLAHVAGPFFMTQPDEMFSLDQFHPSGAGYRRTAKALLPSVLAALSIEDRLPFGHHGPAVPASWP